MKKFFIILPFIILLYGCDYLPIEVVNAEEAGYYDNYDTSYHYHMDYYPNMRY